MVHVSATAFGGGVSEILYTLVPLMRDVGPGLRVAGDLRARGVLQRHEADAQRAQGAPQDLDEEQWDDVAALQRDERARAVRRLGRVPGPRPAARRPLLSSCPRRPTGWMWRCHIDLSTPNPETIAQLLPYIERLSRSRVFHMPDYVPAGMSGRVNIVPPAIDPLAPKNMALSPEDASYVCEQFGIDIDRPLMCQVSRFDPWKDPLGVIDAYRIVQGEDPDAPARAGRVDGQRRPRGVGLLQRHDRPRRRRSRHPHPQQLQQRRRDRGQRLPVALRRAGPEVDPRGLRPDRLGGDLEGAAVHRRQRRAASRCRSRMASPAIWCPASRNAPTARWRSSSDPALGKALGPARQGVRALALPDAALPARLPADLHRAAGRRRDRRPARHLARRWCWCPTAGR